MRAAFIFAFGLLAGQASAQSVVRVQVAPVPVHIGAAAIGASLGTGLLASPSANPALPSSPSLNALHAPSLTPAFAPPSVVSRSPVRGIAAAPPGSAVPAVPSGGSALFRDGSVLKSAGRSVAPVVGNQGAVRTADQKLSKAVSQDKFSTLFDGALGNRRGADAVDASGEVHGRSAPRIAPASYLEEAAGQSGERLLDTLHRISGRNYRVNSYEGARHEMFSFTDNISVRGARGVRSFYSGTFVEGTSGDGKDYKTRGDANGDGYSMPEFMNAEHLWPQSFFKKRSPLRSDLHHIYPALTHTNGVRSALPFGYVPEGKVEYRTRSGAKMGAGHFEPPDEAKGKVARALIYFYTRYLGYNIMPRNGANLFWNDKIEMLLEWNRKFPPTRAEVERNDRVEKVQGNRNPFVDDPGLADRIGAEALKTNQRTSGAYASSKLQPNNPNARDGQKGKSGKRRSKGRRHGRRRR